MPTVLARVAAVALALLARPAAAAFEDAFYSPRGAAMGGAMTAVGGDPVAAFYNPAALGTMRLPALQGSYLRQFHIPAGQVDQDFLSGAAVIPINQELIRGGVGVSGAYNELKGGGLERTVDFGYGSRGRWEFDQDQLDWGAALKFLKKTFSGGGSAPLRPAIDLGILYHVEDRYTWGASIINLNRPSVNGPGIKDRARLTGRVGFTETVRGLQLATDLVAREGPFAGSLDMGLERWWATPRNGSFAGRAGLSLGNRDKTWNWGLGWRMFGGQLDYAMTVPLSGSTRFGHAVGLTFRFGESNPEGEYEKVLATEMSYRRDLARALAAGEVKQWKLAEDLNKMRQEIETLRREILEKSVSEAEAKQKLKDLEERHKRAVESYEKIQRSRDEARHAAERPPAERFADDWSAYQKLKLGGAPDDVLVENVQRLLRDYKDTGVDLSQANQELLRLLRSK